MITLKILKEVSFADGSTLIVFFLLKVSCEIPKHVKPTPSIMQALLVCSHFHAFCLMTQR